MVDKDFPLISTIIPVYNGARYIEEAINSILDQQYPRHEIIVVDDGSTDTTRSVVEKYKQHIRYCYQENRGVSAAMNTGVNMSEGAFLSFLDSDDYWLPGKIDKQMAALRNDPTLDMVFAYVKQFYSPELEHIIKDKFACPEHPVPGTNSGSMIIRRNAFFRVGLLSEKWVTGTFNDWWLRSVEAGLRSVVLPDVLYMRRIHDANHGVVYHDKRADYFDMIKESLRRRKMKPS